MAVRVLSRRNLVALFFLTVAGLAAAAVSSYLLFWGDGTLVNPVRQAVVRTLERRTGLKVSLGALHPAPFGLLVLDGLSAREGTGRELASAEQVTVHLSLWSWLWQRGRITALVSGVELVRPKLRLAREADGTWNFSRYLQPGGAGAGWQGELSLRDGEVTVEGWHPDLHFSGVTGKVSAGPGGLTQVRLAGRSDLLPGARLSVAARTGGGTAGRVDFALAGVDLAQAQRFLPPRPELGRLSAGRGDLRGTLLLNGPQPRLVSAEATVEGGEWRPPTLEAPLTEVAGNLALKGDSLSVNHLSFVFLGTRWSAEGSVARFADPTLDLKLTGENAALSELAATLPASLRPKKLSGLASLDLTARGEWRNPLVTGFLRLSGVSVSIPGGPPVSDLNGTVALAGDGLRTGKLVARVAGGQVRVSGEVRDWRKPHGSLDLHLEGIPTEELRLLAPAAVAARLTPLTEGRVSGDLQLEGVLADPAGRGHLALVGARWADLPVESAEVTGAYAAGRVNVERAVLVAAGGRLAATATASDLAGAAPGFAFSAQVSGVDLALLSSGARLKWPVPVGGRVDALIAGRGEGLAWEKLNATGALSLTEGRVGEERLTSARAGFALAGGELAVDYLNLSSPDGKLTGYGRRTADGRLSGALSGQGLELASLLTRYAPGLPLEGTADLLAEIGGTDADPQLTGEFNLVSPVFRGQPFTDGQGRFHLSRRLFSLDELAVRREAGLLKATGTVGLDSAYPLDLTLTVAGVPAEAILPLAGVQADLTGAVNGIFVVRGPAREALVQGEVELAGGKVAGYPYSRAAARFRYAGGALDLEQVSAEAEGATATGRGRLVGQELNLSFTADRLDLARLPLPGQGEGIWKGTGSFTGTVRGTLRQPVLEGEVQGAGLAYQTWTADAVQGSMRYQEGRVVLAGLELARGSGRYFLTGEVEPRASRLDLRLRIDRGDLAEVARLLPARQRYDLSGQATGVLHVWGGFRNPSARLLAETDDATLAGVQVAGDLDLALRDGEVTINRLRLGEVGGDGLLVALGHVGRASLDLQVRARRVDVAPLTAVLRFKAQVAGKADADLVVRGTVADPQADLTVTVAEAKVNGVSLNDLHGRATYAGGAVHLAEALLVSGDQKLTAAGTWPLAPSLLKTLGLKDSGQPWDLQVGMNQGDLGLLSFILPDLGLSGPGSVSVRLTGPAEAPQVAGMVVAAGATVNHPSLGGQVTRLTGRIDLGPEGLSTQGLTGFYNGGETKLSGKVALAGLAVKDLDLTLSGRDVHYQSPVFEAWLDADLTVRGPLGEAVIAGKGVLNRSTLTLGARSALGRITWNPRLNLTVSSREDLRVVTADRMIDARAYGTLALRGRLANPTFTGEAETSRGTIVYLDTPFRITRGQAVFAAYRGILPTLDVTAEAVVPVAGASPSEPVGRQDLRVTLSVTGPTEKLALNLSSDPPLSQADIVSALSLPGDITRIIEGNQAAGGREAELLRVAGQQLSNKLFSGVELAVADALQLDQFTLTQGFQEKNVQLHVGKYLVDNVYLTYSRTLEMTPWESIGVEYRIRPGLTVNGSLDNQGDLKWGFEVRHRF